MSGGGCFAGTPRGDFPGSANVYLKRIGVCLARTNGAGAAKGTARCSGLADAACDLDGFMKDVLQVIAFLLNDILQLDERIRIHFLDLDSDTGNILPDHIRKQTNRIVGRMVDGNLHGHILGNFFVSLDVQPLQADILDIAKEYPLPELDRRELGNVNPGEISVIHFRTQPFSYVEMNAGAQTVNVFDSSPGKTLQNVLDIPPFIFQDGQPDRPEAAIP